MSEPKKSSMVLKSIASGIDNSMTCLTEDTYYECASPGGTNGGCASANADFDTCTNADLGNCEENPAQSGGVLSGGCAAASQVNTNVLRTACTDSACLFDATDACEFKGTCGTRTFADTVNAMT